MWKTCPRIHTRLDNCTSLLINLPDKDLSKLQRIQNSSARLVTLSRKRDHITPVLFELHWLPVQYRINFKVLLLAYKILCDMAPAYKSDMIHPYIPIRTLRSSSKNLLQMPSARTVTYGERAFSFNAPRLSNNPDLSVISKNSWRSIYSISLLTVSCNLCFIPASMCYALHVYLL